MLDGLPRHLPDPSVDPNSLVEPTRKVVETIVAVAEWNNRNPVKLKTGQNAVERLTGDKLTDLYFRRAAAGAQFTPTEVAPRAFLLGLAIGLDDASSFRTSPLTAEFSKQVETDTEHEHRLSVLGTPTMRGRRDLARHFVVSCGLAAIFGPELAETVGTSDELLQASRSHGMSFASLASNAAGMAFAEKTLGGTSQLPTMETAFTVEDFLPTLDGLAENVTMQQFLSLYGSAQDDRFVAAMAAIRRRILSVPAYAGPYHGNGRATAR